MARAAVSAPSPFRSPRPGAASSQRSTAATNWECSVQSALTRRSITKSTISRSETRSTSSSTSQGNRSFSDLKRVLADGGHYVLIGHDRFGHSGGRWFGKALLRFVRLAVFRPLGRMRIGSKLDTQGRLKVIRELLDSGQVAPQVDRVFPLSDAVEAMTYLESGAAAGKVILTV